MHTRKSIQTIIFGALVAVATACSGAGLDENEARIAFRHLGNPTTCLEGIDADGDGITDYFDIAQARFVDGLSPRACFASGGTVLEILPTGRGLRAASGAGAGAAALPTTTNYSAGGDIPDDVQDAVDALNLHNTKRYQQPHSDCDDFSNELETYLEKEGYDGTYTEICKIGDERNTHHAITDVHIDGETYWVDGMTGKQVKLDQNGDGQVTAGTSGEACATATEGGWGIRVWDNLGERIDELGSPDF